jgi:hypothetical protein
LVPFGGHHLWSDFRRLRIGSHHYGALILLNHPLLGHHGVLRRGDHFFVAVVDPVESLLAESTLLL